jgi:hypothetical protein
LGLRIETIDILIDDKPEVAAFIAHDLRTVTAGQTTYRFEPFSYLVKSINPLVGAYPDNPMLIVVKTPDEVTADAGRIGRIIIKGFESIPIKTVESIDGPDPKKSVIILDGAFYGIIRKPALHLVMIKVIRLSCCITAVAEDEKGQNRYLIPQALHQVQISPKKLVYFPERA